MPPLNRWIQFLTGSGICIGAGVAFVKYGTPSDEQFLRELSPDIKAQVLKERAYRERADQIMQKKTEETLNKPAWLQGAAAMQKLTREVNEEARAEVDREEQANVLNAERMRLKELAEKERRMK